MSPRGPSAAVIRARVERLRVATRPEESRRAGDAAAQRFASLASHWSFWSGARVALYRAIRGEISLGPLEKWLTERGSLLHYPRVIDPLGGVFEMVEAGRGASSWARGHFGIEEPAAGLPVVEPDAIDVVFVPGVAFGPKGERIGRGKGFYDRFLTRVPRSTLRAALAYEFQVVGAFETNPWDQGVDLVVTEKREIAAPTLAEWRAARGI